MASEASMHQQFLHRLSSVLDVHLGEEHFGVKELAREVGLSKSQLLRKLKALKNKSTSQFIREYRLRKANELLRQEAGTASEIAYRVGFSSPTYFSTCFHEYFGYPPGEAKLRNTGNTEWVSDNKLESQLPSTHSKKRLILLFTLGAVLLVATSFALYLGIKTGIPEVEQNLPAAVDMERPEAEKSIGVLPFVNLSGTPEFEDVSEGMTGAITDKLTKIKSFEKVVPFTTMATFKETDRSIQEIASELGVTHLLEGNLQKAGDTVKIVLRLIDGKADTYEWSEEFTATWDIGSLFEMQAKVAENVAAKMGIEITGKELNDIGAKETENLEAYVCFQRAGYHKNFYDAEGFDVAEQLYNQAIQLDASFTEPYLGLAYIWQLRAWQGLQREHDAIAKAIHYLKLALDQGTEDSWAVDTYYTLLFWYKWDFETLESLFQAHSKQGTLLQMPRSADYSVKTGRAGVALRIMDQLIESNLDDAKFRAEKLRYLVILGKLDEFEKLVKEETSLFSDDRDYNGYLAKLYLTLGDYRKAQLYANKFRPGQDNYFHGGKIYFNWLNAVISATNGNELASEKYLTEIKNIYDDGDSLGNPGWYLALYYSAIGDFESAIHWLQKSFDQHEVEMTWLYAEPLLEPIRNDPRYKELLHKVGFTKVISL